MSVLVVGSVAIDDIRTPFGSASRVLGGSASYFSLAAVRFGPVRVVAVVGEDFPSEHLRLLGERGVEVGGVRQLAGASFYWSGSYSPEMKQATTHETRLGVFEQFNPELDAEDRNARLVFLANIDPDLQLKVLDQVGSPELVVLDTMNYWIESKLDALWKVIERVDVVLLNDEELRLLSGEPHLVLGARRLLERGPRAIIVKKGEHGAFLETADDYFALPAYPTEEVHDPTGAGDTFAGGFVGYLSTCPEIDGGALRRAVAHGTVMASFTVESFSIDRLLTIGEDEIADRLRRLQDITRFA